jgi:hypothetical protein
VKFPPTDKTFMANAAKIQEHLDAIKDLLAPRECPMHEQPLYDCDPDECSFTWEQAKPIDGLVLTEWGITTLWMDLESGGHLTQVHSAPAMIDMHVKALFQDAAEGY